MYTAEWPHQEYLIAESEERTDSGIVQIHLYILLQNQVQNEEVLSEDFQTKMGIINLHLISQMKYLLRILDQIKAILFQDL